MAPVYNPTVGVKNDFSALMQRFVETNSVRYEQFVEIWKEMNMSLIFAGRQTDIEVREFAEECLSIALTFIQPSNEFQQQIAGLYLLYSIYFKQPLEPKAKIRVSITQWENISNIVKEVSLQKHYDVECIYWTLQHQNAFHFAATPLTKSLIGTEPDAPEDSNQRSVELQTEIEQLLQKKSSVSDIMGSEANAIDQLSAIHDQYHSYKCALLGPDAKKPQASLDMIDSNLVQHITKKITTYEWWKKNRAGKKSIRRRQDSGPTTSESEGESESERVISSPGRSKSIGRIRAMIKEKAMKSTGTASRSRRHRQARNISDLEQSPSRANTSQSSRLDSEEEDIFRKDSHEPSLSSSMVSDAVLPSMPVLEDIKEPKSKKRKKKQQNEKPAKKPKVTKKQAKDLSSSMEVKTDACDESLVKSPNKHEKPGKRRKVTKKQDEVQSSLKEPKTDLSDGSIVKSPTKPPRKATPKRNKPPAVTVVLKKANKKKKTRKSTSKTPPKAKLESGDVGMSNTPSQAILESSDVGMSMAPPEAELESADVEMSKAPSQAKMESADAGMSKTPSQAELESADAGMSKAPSQAKLEPGDVGMSMADDKSKIQRLMKGRPRGASTPSSLGADSSLGLGDSASNRTPGSVGPSHRSRGRPQKYPPVDLT